MSPTTISPMPLMSCWQTCDKLLIEYKMTQELNIDQEERLFILLAAYAHDNGHQGLTNNYYINSQDPLAINYSNQSPLQRMHSSNLMQALKTYQIPVSEKHKKLMVQLILATDNKHHFEMINKILQYQQQLNQQVIELLNNGNDQPNQSPKKEIIQSKYKKILLQMIIHTADLSPCGKPIQDYLKWNNRLYDEFKIQYRKQRQIKLKQVSFHFDLENEELSIVKENLNFFNKMVLPFFKEVSVIIPRFSYEFNNAIKIRNHFQQKAKSLQAKKASAKIIKDKGPGQQDSEQNKQKK